MNSISQRLAALRHIMSEQNEAAFLVTDGSNRRYLSGFTGSAGWLLITGTQQWVITDGRYWEQAQRQCPEYQLFKFESSEHKALAGALKALLEGEAQVEVGARLCLELDGMTLVLYRNLESELQSWTLGEADGRTRELRQVKDSEEIALLRLAAQIADEALDQALKQFRPGQRESDLRAELEYHILRLGGEGASFSTIVASGVNGSYPHAGASSKVVEEGELITIDFGARYQGYCSDMTRTIWFGHLSERQREILSATREAQSRAVAAVRPGITSGELDAIARDYLEERELAQYFIHSLGHGIGLEVHEGPTLRKGTELVLQAGQLVTVEPGVYIPEFTGCRVEDTILVTPDGGEPINRFPKQDLTATHPPNLAG